MKKLLLCAALACAVLVVKAWAYPYVSISASPNPVYTNNGFTVSASGSDDNSGYVSMTLVGPSGYIGTYYPSWGTSVSADVWQTAPGSPTTLNYTAYLDGDYGTATASTSVTVQASNHAPTIEWVTNPGSAPVNGWFTVQARGRDEDGNLTNVVVWRNDSPLAYNGGGNGYENITDGNGCSQGSPGPMYFRAQAYDSSGASSEMIYWTVNIYNRAPSVAWHTVIPSVNVNQGFAIRAQGHDDDGNLVSVQVDRDTTPFAYNGGGNGYDNVTDNNSHTASVRGTVSFHARAADATGASTGTIDYDVTVVDRPLENLTITPSGPVTPIGVNNYSMWLGDTLTISSTVRDPDAHLTKHQITAQRMMDGSPTGAQVALTNDIPSDATNSSKSVSYTPALSGRWDYNTWVSDGYHNDGQVVTVYVYGPTNGATWVSQVVDTSNMAVGTTRTVKVTFKNTGDKPWTTDANAHKLGSLNPQGNTTWGLSRVALGAGETVLPDAAKEFTFTITAPGTPGTYNFQWGMVEEGLEWFGAASTNLTINVVDTTAPTTPTGLNATATTHNSFTLNWTASTDNVGVTGYEVMQGATSLGTAAGTSRAITGLTPNTVYAMKVRARDSSGNWSAWSSALNVTTALDPNGDQDNDGMPNGWESSNGFNPNSSADASADPDYDGLSNLTEYNLNTNPNAYTQGTGTQGGAVPGNWPSAGGGSSYAIGATVGTLDVDKSGAANYSIPLWTTPGTSGLQPQLSLNYSSQGGVGLSGFGWSLGGVSAITRGPQTLAIDLRNKGVTVTGEDRFYLDGQRLIAISGNYGADGTVYRTELDSITKVVSYGNAGSGPSYFIAWTKAGLIIEFGSTADSAFDAYGKSEKLTWGVTKISDTKGNYMTFAYTEDAAGGVWRLDRINYTGNAGAGLTPYASVRFDYEDRPDWSSGYVAGSPVSNLKRLKSIRSCLGETVARTYTLNYRNNAGTTQQYRDRSILASLSETASDGRSFAPLSFDYAANELGWEPAQEFQPPYFLADNSNSGRPAGSGFMDLDGDGRVDFVVRRDGGGPNAAYLNNGAGWSASTAYQLPYKMADAATALDQGSRFVDLNSDGLVDYVWHVRNTSNGLLASGAVLNTGSGWVSAPGWVPPVPIAKDNLQLNGGRFVDVNGDGRPDYVAFIDGSGNATNLSVYLNNGTGWTYNAGYSTLGASMATYKGRFVDLNGDGLPDIVIAYGAAGLPAGVFASYLNTGTGWVASTAYQTPVYIANESYPDVGSEFADVNGDGLLDLVWYRESGGTFNNGVAINTGAGWVQTADYTSRYAPPVPLSRDGINNPGSALIDLNADGQADIIRSKQDSGEPSGYFSVQYGTARDWSYAGADAAHNVSMVLLRQAGLDQTGVDFVDFNSDGVPDLIWSRKHPGGQSAAGAWYNKANPINDRLLKVTNAFGVQAQITYASLLEKDGSGNPTVYDKGTGIGPNGMAEAVNVTGPMQVVKSISNDDGTGGQYVVSYRYGGLRAERQRGSLGFEWMKVTDSRTGIVSTTNFMQAYPYIGMPASSETRTGSNVLLAESAITYATKDLNGGATKLPYTSVSRQKSYELNGGALISDVETTTAEPDLYGNVTSISVTDKIGNFVKTTTSVYGQDNPASWFLGRLTSSTVSASAPGKPTMSRSSSFAYDNANGLLISETVEPGNSTLSVKTEYGYDAYGNKTSATVSGAAITVDASGNLTAGSTVSRATSTAYDGQGRFAASSTNALTHQEFYAYDPLLGLMTTLTGPNGLATSWTYDSFGAKQQESRADGTVSNMYVRWAGPSAPGGAKYQIETTATGAAPGIVYYDSFGRAMWSIGLNGNAEIINQRTAYDNQGRAYATSVPYRTGATVYWTQTTGYDVLNRPLSTQTPDDEASGGVATTSFSYGGLTTTATDVKGRISTTVKNSQGWTLSTTRNTGAGAGASDYTQVTYDYDAYGSLTSTNAAGVTTSLTYDQLGRKTAMTDADMGTWQYRYNIFGELIWQKDAKNQITTLSYDSIGRLTQRVEPTEPGAANGLTTWTYDTAPKTGGYWKGKLRSVTSPGGYGETYGYDSLGRPLTMDRAIDGSTYTFTASYDSAGRVVKTAYPTVNGGNFATRNVYSGLGALKEIRAYLATDDAKANSALQGKVYWQADHYNIDGRVDGETYGNGLTNDRIYSAATGRLRSSAIDRGRVTGAPYAIQQMLYTYDTVGNVLTRADTAMGRGESFQYDGLDRLTQHQIVTGVGGTVSVAFNQLGNITSKSDAGNYAYDATKKHAVIGVSGGALGSQTYSYDANGNMNGGGRTITWTAFNQVASVVKGSYSSTFSFGASHERVKQVSDRETTIYVGGLFEKITPVGASPVVEYRHYIMGPTGRIAVYTDRSNLTRDTKYYHTDGLGSITAVSDEKGAIVQRFAFDAWGKRLNPATGAVITGATRSGISRGYTDHEQLDDLGLIHMNGRIYDPVLGRFLSADPNIDGVSDAQGYNRYSYVGNNPMNATDPSGYRKLGDILKQALFLGPHILGDPAYWFAPQTFNQYYGQAAGIAVTAVVTYYTGNPALGGAAGGFVSGFSSSLLNGGSVGDSLRSGAIGAGTGYLMGAITGAIGTAFGPVGNSFWTELGRAAAHGVVGGAYAEATGGDFRHGFLAGFAGSVGGSLAPSLGFAGYSDRNFSAIAARTAFAAIIGGTAAGLGGGKFANGAVTAAFQHLLNAEVMHGSEMTNKERKTAIRMKTTNWKANGQYEVIDELWVPVAEDHGYSWGATASRWVGRLTGTLTASVTSETDSDELTVVKAESLIAEYQFETKVTYKIFNTQTETFSRFESKTEFRFTYRTFLISAIPLMPDIIEGSWVNPNNYIVPKWNGDAVPWKEWRSESRTQ